jgi:hypothetical protein
MSRYREFSGHDSLMEGKGLACWDGLINDVEGFVKNF